MVSMRARSNAVEAGSKNNVDGELGESDGASEVAGAAGADSDEADEGLPSISGSPPRGQQGKAIMNNAIPLQLRNVW